MSGASRALRMIDEGRLLMTKEMIDIMDDNMLSVVLDNMERMQQQVQNQKRKLEESEIDRDNEKRKREESEIDRDNEKRKRGRIRNRSGQ